MPTKSTLSKLSRAQARVVIAKDAIANVKAHQNANEARKKARKRGL